MIALWSALQHMHEWVIKKHHLIWEVSEEGRSGNKIKKDKKSNFHITFAWQKLGCQWTRCVTRFFVTTPLHMCTNRLRTYALSDISAEEGHRIPWIFWTQQMKWDFAVYFFSSNYMIKQQSKSVIDTWYS